MAGNHANLGASQLNSATPDAYHTKGSINALLPWCKFYHIAEDSTPALAGKAQAAAAHGASRICDGVRLWQRRVVHLHT